MFLLKMANRRITEILALCIIVAALLIVGISRDTLSKTYYDNTSITSKLNVSNVAPTVNDLVFYKVGAVVSNPIVLEEGITIHVKCNATINDSNGVGDIASVNATIYKQGYSGAADNNKRYVNASCAEVSQVNSLSKKYTCSFYVWYYAENGTWVCNVTALDTGDLSNYSTTTKSVEPLYALNLGSTEIDFSELDPGQESASDEKMNITNYGNINLRIAVKGYARTEGDGQAMNCTVGNISIGYERYSLQADQAWSAMTALASSWTNITDLVVPYRTNDNDNNNVNSTNTTYWKIKAPYGTRGVCNGTIVFSAVPPP